MENRNLLQIGFSIRAGCASDIGKCDGIARMQEKLHPSSLGWVRKEDYETFNVALAGKDIIGFVIYHTLVRGKENGWNTVKALAVDPAYEGLGVGRNLLYSVDTPIILRCPQFSNGELNRANGFYYNAGFRLKTTETIYRGGNKKGQNRKNPLNVWVLPILPILVMGSNSRMPECARKTGWAYGTREIEIPQDWAYQVDIDLASAKGDWRSYHWESYLGKIARWKPFSALVVDYFEPAQTKTMLKQVQDLKDLGVMRVLVCPKFKGAVKDIPESCVVALSIPSRYAAFMPDKEELIGKKVHFLGGSPVKWFGSQSGRKNSQKSGYLAIVSGYGAKILAVDGNSHQVSAVNGTYWENGRQRRPVDRHWQHGDWFNTMLVSGKNILEDLHDSASSVQTSHF